MLRRVSVGVRLWIVVLIPTVMIVVVGGLSVLINRQVSIGSDSYQQIVSAKDLSADILPPPEYIVETQLTVMQLSTTTEDTTVLTVRLSRLEAEYTQRHAYWEQNLKDPSCARPCSRSRTRRSSST